MTTIPNVLPGAEGYLSRIEAAIEAWICSFATSSPTLPMLRYHFGLDEATPRRGKRLRPRMLLAVAEEEAQSGHFEEVLKEALVVACAVELLHNFSLIHDDIEDGDELRHGRQTVWSRFGMPHGINAGDALSALSYLSILQPGRIADPARAAKMANCLQEAHLAMCWGQGFDLAFEHAAHVTYNEYVSMIQGKTAALFAASCALGAIAAGAPEGRIDAYAAMGSAYGRAFQIQDDILGIWGDTATTGKPKGADLRRRKWSFPIAWALSYHQGSDSQTILQAYAEKIPLPDEIIHEVVACLDRLGAHQAAREAASAAWAEAESLAKTAQLDHSGTLRRLLHSSLGRHA